MYETLIDELETGKRKPRFPKGIRPRSDGLVALGGDLSVEMLLEAYSKGYFPWSGDAPIPWYCPQPRMLLFPEYLHVSRSLQKSMRKQGFHVTFDQRFRDVMEQCSRIPRSHEEGTWITDNMIDAYCQLYELKVAHSVEVYHEGELCGGLYGLSLGRAFFGESMFSAVSNASKVALVYLCAYLQMHDFDFIDCQVVTSHLLRMGGHPVPRRGYLALLKRSLNRPSLHTRWSADELRAFNLPRLL